MNRSYWVALPHAIAVVKPIHLPSVSLLPTMMQIIKSALNFDFLKARSISILSFHEGWGFPHYVSATLQLRLFSSALLIFCQRSLCSAFIPVKK